MPGKVQISIPTPCHENWEVMSPTDKGRFCASCQKNVIDFRKASDSQIATALKQSDNLCGRFKPSQLERDLVISKEKNKLWVAASAAVVTLLTIGNHTLSAQTVAVAEQTDSKSVGIKLMSSDTRTIKGTVVDNANMPIPGTMVRNKNSNRSTQADFDGIFILEAKSGDTISFEYIGMLTTQVIVSDGNEYNIALQYDGDIELVMVGGITTRRTFFGRIFHSIGNIFR